jgi:hypothetical protein
MLYAMNFHMSVSILDWIHFGWVTFMFIELLNNIFLLFINNVF